MKEVLIEEEKSILEAMKQLDKSAKKVLFVHKEGKLLAALTDGDIRRWILKKGDLQISIKHVAKFFLVWLQTVLYDGQLQKKYDKGIF